MRLAVLTGGGDCPGLNAAIRAVVRASQKEDMEVLGVKRGWLGLVRGDVEPLDSNSVSGIIQLGGTILGTSRTNPMKKKEDMDAVLEHIEEHKIDVIVAIGGDDTLSVAAHLYEQGMPTVGIPKTMDNDVAYTDYCIGFDSAVSIVTEALDRLHTTATAHHRVIVVEVMGRDTGWVAIVGGLAGGADFILIPEVEIPMEVLAEHLTKRVQRGKSSSIIVVAEGQTFPEMEMPESDLDAFGHIRLDKKNVAEFVTGHIERMTGFEARATVLGHLQRGGSPSVFDRVLATRLGVAAIEHVKGGRFGRMMALQGNEITSVGLKMAIENSPRKVSRELWNMAQLFY